MSQRISSKVPKSLAEALMLHNRNDFRVVKCYYIEIDHQMKYLSLPVVSVAGERMLVSLDLDLIRKVWEGLPPRASRLTSADFYVSKHLSIAFHVSGRIAPEHLVGEDLLLLTHKRLYSVGEGGFRWPEYFGRELRDLSRDEFKKVILNAYEREIHQNQEPQSA
ncbi:hypothetical protein KW790_01900 [Candidatus Parcubacteria bacterium]|nr:hypothetical protein [Candidatus Parcubacteria bacterium]